MDGCMPADMARMALAIEAETENRLKEMAAEAHAEYLVRRKKATDAQRLILEKEIEEGRKNAEEQHKREEGVLVALHRKEIQKLKRQFVETVIQKVRECLREGGIRKGLVQECVDKMPLNSDLVVFCRDSDKSTVVGEMRARGANVVETRSMPSDRCGGVVVETRDGRVVCDNSHETRLQVFCERRMDRLGLFLASLLSRYK